MPSYKKKKCKCRGKSGEAKRIFHSRASAASASFRTNRFCRTYPCPELKGKWHLTHA